MDGIKEIGRKSKLIEIRGCKVRLYQRPAREVLDLIELQSGLEKQDATAGVVVMSMAIAQSLSWNPFWKSIPFRIKIGMSAKKLASKLTFSEFAELRRALAEVEGDATDESTDEKKQTAATVS
jgi:hypothetical protein